MSFREKRTLVTLLVGVALMAFYGITAWGRFKAGQLPLDNLKAWAFLILVFVGIGIGVTIITLIALHIAAAIGMAVKEEISGGGVKGKDIEKRVQAEFREDEMDRMIELKTSKAGYAFAGVGFAAGLLILVLGFAPAIMLNILFLSFWAGSFLEGLLAFYYYRNGFSHGR